MSETIDLTLHVWRQEGSDDRKGRFEPHRVEAISTHASLLEMLDVINERLLEEGRDPIAFDHDCREGICGMCGMVVNGVPHGKPTLTTTCQLHVRMFRDGDEIWLEPFRAAAFPILKDLVIDRGAFDRIIAAGGYVSAPVGSAQDARAALVPKTNADAAFRAAACIGCGACVAACPNASASLFVAAKVSHLGLLPQGQPEQPDRVRRMVSQMDAEGFGACTNHGECEAACPKGISTEFIAMMNRALLRAALTAHDGVDPPSSGGG